MKPHILAASDIAELGDYFNSKAIVGAEATTHDGTMRKSLVKQGGIFLCRARKLGGDYPVEERYKGRSLQDAARTYNELN